MRKVLPPIALIAGIFVVSQAQAADQSVEDRLAALEKHVGKTGVVSPAKNMDVTLYGQVNKAILFADDGKKDDVFFVDNDISSTRFGIKAKATLNAEFSAGAQFEGEYQTNAYNDVNMDNQSHAGSFKKRQTKVYLKSKSAGKVTLGHGSTAADSIAEIDLSGTKIAGNSHMKAQGSDFLFYNTTGDAYSAIAVGDVFDHLDGGRKDGLRYDSPSIAGISLSGGVASENYNDLAIRYAGEFNGTKVKAGMAYSYLGSTSSTHNVLAGSASVMLPFGLDFTLAGGKKEFDDTTYDDGSYLYGKVGYQMKAWAIGSTSVSLDYGQYDDMTGDPTEKLDGTALGLQFIQKANQINTEFYAAYRLYEMNDATVNNYDDISLFWTGARVKF